MSHEAVRKSCECGGTMIPIFRPETWGRSALIRIWICNFALPESEPVADAIRALRAQLRANRARVQRDRRERMRGGKP